MSHSLDFSRGKAAIAYAGEVPWHGLGQKISPDASIEDWQKAAALDWVVEKANVTFTPSGSKKEILTFPNRTVLYRTDTDKGLGIVSDSHFKPVQPGEVLEFYRELVRDQGFKMETAGALKGGQKVWALANIGKPFTVGKTGKMSDKLGCYILFATGMDGSTATIIRLTSIRVVCNNTLNIALPAPDARGFRATKGIEGLISVSHRGKFDPVAVKERLGLFPGLVKPFAEICSELAAAKLTDEQAREFFNELVGKEVDDPKDAKLNNKEQDLLLAFNKGPGSELTSAKNTLWGAVNAVTYYVDHIVGRGADTRLNKAWFGANARLKAKALKLAMETAKIAA
jgi:phage/plasmid-like protein (TIGR03299 family)